MKLSKINEISNLRSVWKDEAKDFTPWLITDQGLELLSEALGLELDDIKRESSVGSFSVDIYATDQNSGSKVIIENQLEATNHDHLGKLITYASGKDAKILVWIVKEARPEHRAAVEWLNNNTGSEIGIFLCEIKLFQIDDSAIAPKLEIIEKPNNWLKEEKENSQVESDRQKYVKQYWSEFVDYADRDPKFHNSYPKHKPQKEGWMNYYFGFGSYARMELCVQTRGSLITAGIYIEKDQKLFDYLRELSLDRKEELIFHKGGHKIYFQKKIPDLDRNRTEQFDWLKDQLAEVDRIFRPIIEDFRNQNHE